MKLRGWPLVCLFALSLCWGYNWILLKFALLDAGPFGFASFRVAIAAGCLLLLLPVTGRPLRPQRVPELILLGVVQTTGFVGLSMWALVEGGVGRTAILVFTMPFWTLLFAWPFLGERIRGGQWVPVLLAAVGLVVILHPWNLTGSSSSKLLAIGAGALWAASSIIVKRIQRRSAMDLLSLTTWQMVFGSIPLLLIAWAANEPPMVWSPRFIVILLLTAVIATALCWVLWIYVLNHLPAGIASMSTLAIPVIAILSSSLQLDERPGSDELLGMGLIAVALLLLSYRAIRQHREIAELAPE